ncbi:MAG: elongation factor G [Acidimicrobiales bacterium]
MTATGVRNIALVGQNGSGKTTLAEALLFATGAIKRTGAVDDGSAACDFEPEEIKSHMSLSLALAPCSVGAVRLNIVDTPGFPDFFSEVRLACSVADLLVVVIGAVEGIGPQTEAVWELAEERKLPRLVFVNKLDREQAQFDRILSDLQQAFGAGIAPLELPIGEASSFRGILDLFTDRAIVYESGQGRTSEIPDDLAATEHLVREQLVEGIVVGDDSLMERYLNGEVPSSNELEDVFATGLADGMVFPVVCGSAATGVGVDRLASLLAEIAPHPSTRPPLVVRAGDAVQEVGCDPAGPPLAHVFKTMSDPYVGKISLARVFSGSIKPGTVLVNSRTRVDERLHVLEQLQGKEGRPVDEARAGDIVAVPKLADVLTGDTLAPKGMPVVVPPPEVEPSVLSIAIRPKSKGDEDKLMTGLHRLQEEDPALVVEQADETHQTLLRGTGETHLSVSIDRLARKFGVEVEIEDVRIPYRETVTAIAEAEGKYKKQSGGHGQFGVACIRIEPLGNGEGFQFVDKVVGGAIPRQYIPAVEKGIVEAMAHGGVHGYPVVDLRAVCFDGKSHPVDSSEMSFKMAGSLAFREAIVNAAPVILEPVSRVTVTIPISMQGPVLSDLTGRRGRVQGTEPLPGGRLEVNAVVPTSEMNRYAVDLRSLTGGRGRFRTVHDHYSAVPGNLVDRLTKVGRA